MLFAATAARAEILGGLRRFTRIYNAIEMKYSSLASTSLYILFWPV